MKIEIEIRSSEDNSNRLDFTEMDAMNLTVEEKREIVKVQRAVDESGAASGIEKLEGFLKAPKPFIFTQGRWDLYCSIMKRAVEKAVGFTMEDGLKFMKLSKESDKKLKALADGLNPQQKLSVIPILIELIAEFGTSFEKRKSQLAALEKIKTPDGFLKEEWAKFKSEVVSSFRDWEEAYKFIKKEAV